MKATAFLLVNPSTFYKIDSVFFLGVIVFVSQKQSGGKNSS